MQISFRYLRARWLAIGLAVLSLSACSMLQTAQVTKVVEVTRIVSVAKIIEVTCLVPVTRISRVTQVRGLHRFFRSLKLRLSPKI